MLSRIIQIDGLEFSLDLIYVMLNRFELQSNEFFYLHERVVNYTTHSLQLIKSVFLYSRNWIIKCN